MRSSTFDIAIVGGGMVGASLAVALRPLGLRVALIESVPLRSDVQPSFDDRTTALSNGSRRILASMGIWPGLEHEAAPIRRIHVSDQGRFGFARIDAREEGVAALGYVAANRAIGAALWKELQSTDVEVLCPARVEHIEMGSGHMQVRVRAQDAEHELSARLVVAADGANSVVRQHAGIEVISWDYEQTAIITNVATQRFHDHIAYERFTPTGPLAVLPLPDGTCTVVWTLAPELAEATMNLDDPAFLAALQARFGFRLGRFTRVGRRHAYPLVLTRADERIGERLVIIGNAAQGLHPIAGQGFNLGLRDVAALAEAIADAREDPGSAAMLERYDEWRRTDRRSIIAFTDGLVRLFGNPLAPVKALRDMGLLLFDVMPPAKSALALLSMGVAGRLPKLSRGIALT
ncbi:MAG TPA: 2-octaprenyl-6-methoxyphenyl hydroxylase [Steroidobacteraceae bacterium]|nr:2-octaprenyl-6-methoxyphenyl hydroxylase [Steroidobacteraceae bacterium]